MHTEVCKTGELFRSFLFLFFSFQNRYDFLVQSSLHFPTADRKVQKMKAGPSKQETIDLTASSWNEDCGTTCLSDDEDSLDQPEYCRPSNEECHAIHQGDFQAIVCIRERPSK